MGFWKRLFGSDDREPVVVPGGAAAGVSAPAGPALPVLRVDPGVSAPRVVQGHDDSVWVLGAHRACLVALDPQTGNERQLLELDLPDDQAYGLSAVRSSGVWIVESRDELSGFEAESDRRLWRTPRPEGSFRLVSRGATPFAADDGAAPYFACPAAGGTELRRLDPRTGSLTAVARLSFPLIDLFAVHGNRLLVGHATEGLSSFDATTGARHWTVHIPDPQRGDDVLGPVIAGERAWIAARSWQSDGPHTTLSPVSMDGRGVGAPLRFEGALDWACASRDLVGVVTTHPRRERTATVLIPGGPRAELVVPESLGPVGMVADGEAIVLIASGGRLALAMPGPAGIQWTEAPLPAGVSTSGALVGGVLACPNGHDLLLIDTRRLRAAGPAQPRRATRLVGTPSRPAASGSTEAAEVVMSGASAVILVQHPRFGRVPLSVAAGHRRPLQGDRIAFEEISEKPGGVIEVHRWRLLDTEATAPGVPEMLAADWLEAARDKPFVQGDLVERLGPRAVPALLRKIFERHDADPVFRWLCDAATGLSWRVAPDEPGLDAIWEAEAFPFATDESGRIYAMGAHVVAYDPESGVVADQADELAVFLEDRLQSAAELSPSAPRVFREVLGLPAA